MFRFLRRLGPDAGVHFCDGCGEISTAADRARRRRDRAIVRAHAVFGPH